MILYACMHDLLPDLRRELEAQPMQALHDPEVTFVVVAQPTLRLAPKCGPGSPRCLPHGPECFQLWVEPPGLFVEGGFSNASSAARQKLPRSIVCKDGLMLLFATICSNMRAERTLF